MKTVKNYESPLMEVVNVEVEQGFAASPTSLENPLFSGDYQEW